MSPKKNPPKHVYFFSSYNVKGVSSRYRGLYVLNELHKQYNITGSFIYPGYTFREIYNFITSYLKVLFMSRNDAIVIYQKLHTNGIYTNLLKLLIKVNSKGSIYDTDDADYLRYYDKNIYYFLRKCQMVTVGSEALAKFAKDYNKNVTKLTSPVTKHQKLNEGRNEKLHLGWVGDYGLNKGTASLFSHKLSFNALLLPALKELNFNFKFTLLGIKNPDDKIEIEDFFKNNQYITLDIPEDINWLDETSVYQRISEFDIGFSPMLDSEFNRSKSAFKVKQYLSCGVPVLASPVGENNFFVKDGTNGFLCTDKNDFKNRIKQIHNMEQTEYDKLRQNTGIDLDKFSMKTYCETLLNGISNQMF